MDKNMQIEEYFEQLEVIAEHCLSDGDLKQFNQALSAIEREVKVLSMMIDHMYEDENAGMYLKLACDYRTSAEKEVK